MDNIFWYLVYSVYTNRIYVNKHNSVFNDFVRTLSTGFGSENTKHWTY